ncbi:MAG: formylglycine-generating enzyme family protein, partial [Bacteroidales bacterium]|nr:formylglycine-generating enzyme family protein [Bacteroidales bacterium]
MKKTFLMCMGMVLCLLSVLFMGCGEKEKDKVPEDAVAALESSMVYVEGGTFSMGATSEQGSDYESDEKPVHSVTLSDFYIGKYEVTQSQWVAVMGTNPCSSSFGLGDDYPVYDVSWEEANEFCAKLSELTGKTYRLPTEAEWEYAARGGQKADGTKYA